MQKIMDSQELVDAVVDLINKAIGSVPEVSVQMELRIQVNPLITILESIKPYLKDRVTFPTARSYLIDSLRYLDNVADLALQFPSQSTLLKKIILTVREQIRKLIDQLTVQIQYDQDELAELQQRTEALQYQLASIAINAKKQAVVRRMLLDSNQPNIQPTCFISYAWPDKCAYHKEAWVQVFLLQLYDHLQLAGIRPKLDLVDNKQGDNIYEFMRQAHECDFVILIGTPSLLAQHNHPCWRAVKVEMSHIIHKQDQDALIDETRVIPILLQGTREESFLPLQQRENFLWDWRKQSYCQNLAQLIDRLFHREHNAQRWQVLWQQFPELEKPFAREELEAQGPSLQSYYNNAIAELVKTESYAKLSQQRESDHLSHLALEQERTTLPQTITPFDGRFQLPIPFADFTGRHEILAEIEKFAQLNTATVITNAEKLSGIEGVVNHQRISGTSGIGKTLTAVISANRMLARYQQDPHSGFASVIWLYAGSDDQQNTPGLINGQMIDLGLQLGIDTAVYKGKVLYKEIYRRLQLRGRTLVVFDNSHGFDDIAPYLPEENAAFHVLITTRNSNQLDWADGFHVIPVGIFDESEALLYIAKVLNRKDEKSYVEEEAKNLAWELGYFPLALTQALAVITADNLSIAAYIERFVRQKKYYLDKEPSRGDAYVKEKNSKGAVYDPHKATVWTTLQLCLERITSEETRVLLRLCGCLAAELPIDIKLLERCSANDLSLGEGLETLRKYSLVENASIDNHVRIHRLVQEITRLMLDDESYRAVLKAVADGVGYYFEERTQPLLDEIKKKRLLSHLIAIIEQMQTIGLQDQQIFQRELPIMRIFLGNIYMQLGEYKKAQFCHQSAGDTFLTLGHVRLVAVSRASLGIACALYGEQLEALEHLEYALPILEDIYGSEHSEVAFILTNLGGVYVHLHKNSQAVTVLKRAIEIYKKQLVDKKQYYGLALMNLGNAQNQLGQHEEARLILEESLEVERATFGKDHMRVAFVMVNLGNVYMDLGNADHAKILQISAVEICERSLGKMHLETARGLVCLGETLTKMGEREQAKIYLERACKIYELQYQEHPELFMNMIKLSETYQQQGNFPAAKLLLEQYLSKHENAENVGHFPLVTVRHHLGVIYREMGLFEDAISLLNHVLTFYEKLHGRNHPSVANTLTSLGNVYKECGQFEQSIRSFSEALSIIETCDDGDESKVVSVLVCLGGAYCSSGRIKEAKPLLKRALRIEEKKYGEESHHLTGVLLNLSETYTQDGKYEKSRKLLTRLLAIEERFYGKQHPYLAMTIGAMANLCHASGELANAKQLYSRSLAIVKQSFGEFHPQVATGLYNQALVMRELGDKESALQNLEECKRICLSVYGEGNQKTAGAIVKFLEIKYECKLDETDVLMFIKFNSFSPAVVLGNMISSASCLELRISLKKFILAINESVNNEGFTALHLAVVQRRVDHANVLLAHGARADICDLQNLSAIDKAIQVNYLPMLNLFKQWLLNKYQDLKIQVYQLDKLVRACAQNNDPEGLKLLVHLGVLIDVPGPTTGNTALHCAVIKRHSICAQILLEAGANPHQQNHEKKSPLDYAADNPELLEILEPILTEAKKQKI